MKNALVFLFIALIAATSASAADLNQLALADMAAGWKLLFDGKSLTGWRGYEVEAPGAGWRAADGVLSTSGNAGDLVSVAEFGDFELSIDWKISEGGNSGIIYRVGLGDSATYQTGPEYQVLDNQKAEDNKIASHLAGSLYALVAPPQDYTKPVGEWNEARIVVRGWKIEHWLNGHKTTDIDLGSADGKALIADSKFKKMPKFATLSRGHLALQDHHYAVSFRNIKIRELK